MGNKNIKKEMMKVKGGDFPKWYNSLTEEEKIIYHTEFKKLQNEI